MVLGAALTLSVAVLTSAAVVAGASASTDVPDWWRWESFRDVEIAVPGWWGHTPSSDRVSCEADTAPEVSRPEIGSLAGCMPLAPTVAASGEFVAFGNVHRTSVAETRGDRTTVVLGNATVTVQAAQPLRERILASLRTIETDAHGCPVLDPVITRPEARPVAVDVRTLTGVTSVAACRYDIRPTGWPQMLKSSVRLDGAAAAAAVVAVAAAPRKAPVPPCGDADPFGGEAIVLRVSSDQGLSRILLRYAGCRWNGFDDGVSLRIQTDASAPFQRPPNRSPYFSTNP